MYYMHHKNTLVIAQKYHRVNTILIPTSFAQSTPPIPLGTPVNHNKKWAKITYPPSPNTHILDTPPITNPKK